LQSVSTNEAKEPKKNRGGFKGAKRSEKPHTQRGEEGKMERHTARVPTNLQLGGEKIQVVEKKETRVIEGAQVSSADGGGRRSPIS